MECRTLSSRITSNEGSSKVIVSGGADVRYVSNGLITLGQTPSASKGSQRHTWKDSKGSHLKAFSVLEGSTPSIMLLISYGFRLCLPCHSSSCFLALRGEVFVGAVWARPLFPLTASLLPSSSSLTGLYLSTQKKKKDIHNCRVWKVVIAFNIIYTFKNYKMWLNKWIISYLSFKDNSWK